MNNPFFERPILNSPYEYPNRHWDLDDAGQPTRKIVETRRHAGFITPLGLRRVQRCLPNAARLRGQVGIRIQYNDQARAGWAGACDNRVRGGMPTPIPLQDMMIEEKLQTMKSLWAGPCAHPTSMTSPAWHGEVPAEREAGIACGEEQFEDWEATRRNIDKDIR